MSKIEDELISKDCYAMQDIILENFTREAKWLYYQMDIVKYLQDKGIDLVCGYEQRIDNLQLRLDKANHILKGIIMPKFKKDDIVYALFTQTEIYKGQIDAFDYYTNSYLVFPNEDVGNEWVKADKVFKTMKEAQAKLQELRGCECHSN